jgi:beta-N-acetylhexosaminidase
MSGPTDRELALRTLLPAFPGTAAPDWARRLVAEGSADSPCSAATWSTTRRSPRSSRCCGRAAGRHHRHRRGGRRRHPALPPAARTRATPLGAVDDVDLTRAIYGDRGRTGRGRVTLDIAPAVDVNSVDENPAIGTRSFSADPTGSRPSDGAVTGLQEVGVAACAKHFPATARPSSTRTWTCRWSTRPRNCSGGASSPRSRPRSPPAYGP